MIINEINKFEPTKVTSYNKLKKNAFLNDLKVVVNGLRNEVENM